MPAPPEFGHRGGDIGLVKILQQPETEYPGEANRHVRIAGEVEVDRKCEEDHAGPGLDKPQFRRVVREDEIGSAGQRVGEQHLLDDPQHEAGKAEDEIVDMGGRTSLHLAGDVVILDDRAGQELWKEEHVKRVERDAPRRRRDAAMDIDEIGDLFKNNKGDADGQRDLGNAQPAEIKRAEQSVEIHGEKAGVFIIDEDADIGEDAELQPVRPRPRPLAKRENSPRDEKIERDRGEDDEHEDRLAPSVKNDAGEQQHERPRRPPGADREI